jgi:phospholipid/cholesterol/gamma-HCH transport system substrate-binding protein
MSRVSRTITGATRRLEGHKLALGFAVAAIGALLAWVAWSSVNGVPLQDRYTLKVHFPDGSPIVSDGDAVRIGGQLAGLVTDVQPEQGAAEVTMELRPQFAPVGRDARAIVRVKSIVYLTYVEIRPGETGDPMPEGGTIPVRHAGSNVDLLEVVQLFDREARESLQRSIYNTGIGLAGRGTQLNTGIHDLEAAVRHATPQLQALTRRPGALAEVVAGAAATFRGLVGVRADDVGALIGSGGAVLATVAGRSAELGRTIELLPSVNDEFLLTAPLLDPVLDDATALSETLAPVVDDLDDSLAELNGTLAMGDELRRETARLTGAMRPVLEAAAPVLAALEATVASVDPALEPLNRIVDVIRPYADDLSRAGQGLVAATSARFPQGQTAPGNPALRFAPIFTPAPCRDPFPEPGATEGRAC